MLFRGYFMLRGFLLILRGLLLALHGAVPLRRHVLLSLSRESGADKHQTDN
jgi:hypothetical protein